MKTVLVFAHECAPYHRTGSTIGAQRPAQFAKHLSLFGWRTIIICCDINRRRKADEKDLPEILKSIDKKISESDPTQPLILATPSFKAASVFDRIWIRCVTEKADGTFEGKGKIASLVRKPFTFLKYFTGDYSEAWQPVAKATADHIAAKIKIDICIGEHGPDAGIFLANWFSGKYNIPWIADFRDPVFQPFAGFALTIYKIVIYKLLANCSATVNVNAYLQKLDHEAFRLPAYSIPNGYDEDEFPDTSSGKRNNRFTISYFGSFSDQIQDLNLFLKGLKIFRDRLGTEDHSKVRFLYRGLGFKSIVKRAATFGVEDITDSQNFVSREESKELMLSSDILLLLSVASYLDVQLYYKEGLYPGKTFEYFGARKPILCVPGDKGVLDTLISESQTGIICRNENEIADYLQKGYEYWSRESSISYSPNETVIRKYTRKSLTSQLGKILDTYALKDNS